MLFTFFFYRASLVAQMVENLPAMQETCFRSLDREDPLEKEMAAHSSILAWRIPWTEEPAGYSPWCRKETDTTEQVTLLLSSSRGWGPRALYWVTALLPTAVLEGAPSALMVYPFPTQLHLQLPHHSQSWFRLSRHLWSICTWWYTM